MACRHQLSVTSVITYPVTQVLCNFSCVSHSKTKGWRSKMYEVQGTVPFRIKRPLSKQQPNDMNNILSIFLCLFFFFLAAPLQHAGFRISVPPPGIKPMPPAVEARSLNHWTAGKSLSLFFIGKTEEQKSSVAFTGSYSQYVTVSTELRNLRNLHRNQGYRLFHNLFLPRTHAHVRAHAHTHTQRHTGFFIMPSFPFSHICLALTPYLTLIA